MIRLRIGKGGAAIGMLALLIMMALGPGGASAHSALTSAVPGETSDTAVSELALTFNEPIDEGGKLTVKNAAGEEQPAQAIAVKGRKLTATFDPPLQNGSYEVNWRIISADGHPLKGSYTMKVVAPEPTPTPSPTSSADVLAEASAQPSSSPSQAPPAAAATSEAAANQGESEGGGSWDSSIVLLVGAAAVLLVVIAGTALKQRKK